MIKRTLFFSNPYYLKTANEQLVIVQKKTEKEIVQPIEDIGFIVLDHPQISVSYPLMQKLAEKNVAVIFCDKRHLPTSMMLPLEGHHIQNERFRHQVNASEPLKKQLWKQTIEAKIKNQSIILKKYGKNNAPLERWLKEVKSGDPSNKEGQAARYYWSHVFTDFIKDFKRDRYGLPPNNMLNYAYAILRAAMARAIAGSGLLATLGIHHHNRYNAFCLADDMMEPFRPFADELVIQWLINEEQLNEDLTTKEKGFLLETLTLDTIANKKMSPLMVALNKTTSSLAQCFEGKKRHLDFPQILA